MKQYIISDLHFFHQRIIKYAERNKYENTELGALKMTYDIANFIHHNVPDAPGVVIWNLGDVFYGPLMTKQSFEELSHVVSMMKGNFRRLKLVLGNHDRQFRELYLHHGEDIGWIGNSTDMEVFRKLGFDDVYDYPVLFGRFILSHEPVFLEDNSRFLNIHGHTHQMFVDENYFTWKVENHDMVKKAYNDIAHPGKELLNFDEKWEDWKEYIANPHKYINACWDATNPHRILEMTQLSDGCVDITGLHGEDVVL